MDENHKKPQPPTVIIRLTNPRAFEIQIDLGNESLNLARAMLTEAIREIDSHIFDAHAQQKMAQMRAAAAMSQQKGVI